jgi:hypothetical protein
MKTASSTVRFMHFAHNRLFGYLVRTGLIACAIPLVSDTLEAIPETQRALYVEKDGKYHLDVTGVEDTTGLKSALAAERKAAQEATRQAAAWKSLGKTPDEIQALVAAQAQAEQDKLTKAGDWDKLAKQMNDQHTLEISGIKATLEVKDKALSKHLVDSAAVTAIAAAKGVPELLLPHIRSAVKVIEENGDYVVRVLDASGSPRVNGKGEFLTIKDMVGEMRQSEVFGRAFDGTGATGSGSSQQRGGGGAKAITRTAFDAMGQPERVTYIRGGGTVTD